MELTSEEVERYLTKIFTGKEWLFIDGNLIMFKQPNNYIKMLSDLTYDKAYEKAISSGILSSDKWNEIIKERGLITQREKDELERLKVQLTAQEVLLSKTVKVKANQDRIKGIIDKLKSEIAVLEHKITSKLSMSAESKAEEERVMYLCWQCTFDKDDNRYWESFDDFLNEDDVELKNNILVSFLRFKAGIDTKVIRYLSRHSLWRIRYVSSQKVSDPLFGVSTSQYTNDMLNLAYWSNFYQNVYEMLPKDRPPDSIIEDDDALDAYMKSYYEDRNREDAAEHQKHRNLSNRGKLSAFDKEEVIVTQSNELYEDIDYDKPREAQRIKDRVDIKKRTKRSR